MSQQSAKTIPAHERCDVCNGEGIVAYIQSRGGFSEPAPRYKCDGTGRQPSEKAS
jgi:DnaJ-class molecular chaperone